MKTLHECRVLHDGWEMDNVLTVIELENGGVALRTTSHGAECEMSLKSLEAKIAETKLSLEGLEIARAFVVPKKG